MHGAGLPMREEIPTQKRPWPSAVKVSEVREPATRPENLRLRRLAQIVAEENVQPGVSPHLATDQARREAAQWMAYTDRERIGVG